MTFLLLLAGLLALAAGSGCTRDDWNQLFNKTLIDPSMVYYDKPFSSITNLRNEMGFYEDPVNELPENAVEPTPEDLRVQRADYRVIPGDQLEVRVYELDVANQESILRVRVSERGYISLNKINRLYVWGKTEMGIEDTVARAYRDAGVLANPQVTVTALTRINRTFSVDGSFGQPGTYNILRDDFRLFNALALVGGVVNQSLEWIYVIRTKGTPAIPPQADEPADPDAGGDDAAEPLDVPGAAPLSLPGAPEPAAGAGDAPKTDAEPTLPEDLTTWRPEGMSAPRDDADDSPPMRRNGLPEGNGTSAPPAGAGGQAGHWMMVDGKYTWVPEAAGQDAAAGDGDEDAPAGPAMRVIKINLRELRRGSARYNIVMQNGDVIVTPRPVIGEFYMMGNVNRPGVYSLTNRKITLVRALGAAGGFGPLAIPSRVQLIRYIDGGTKQQHFMIDAGAILEGEQEDIVLRPDDVINVGTRVYAPFLAVIRNAFRATYGVGFVYDRNLADTERVQKGKIP